jgi:CDP-diacylglycerol--glycerol-3-phosphate 3-phosphatidyltransferase
MGFIAVVLLPVFSPPATRVAAVLFMLPFLLHFGRDFLWVSGVLRPAAAQSAVRGPRAAGDLEGTRRALRFVLPIMLRGVLAALLLVVLVQQIDSGDISLGVMIVVGMALPGVLLGAAGRILALAVLLMSGFSLQSAPANLVYWLLLLVSTLMFISGTGKYSLWKPEEWLIHHRPGEESS